jgi:hypothetical protein
MLTACAGEAPAPPPAQGLEDDFAQEHCRFGSMEGSTSKGYGCLDGEFRTWIDNDESPYDFIAASAGERLADVRVEVDFRSAGGPEAGAVILCRGSQEGGTYYLFRLGADGTAEITDFVDGEEQIARMGPLPDGALLAEGNRLRAECLGNQLALYLNDRLVLERSIDGEALGPGDIGLGAGGASEGMSDVYFDNLVIRVP